MEIEKTSCNFGEILGTENTQSSEIGELIGALAKAQGEMEGANKSAENPYFRSKYADLHECIQAARKPLSKNGLAVIQTMEQCESGVVIVTTLGHSSGQWIRGKIKMNPKKDDDQCRGSSITYGRRYSFAAIVGLAQKDDDGNAACEEPKSKPAAKKNTETSVDERFSKAIDWISGLGKQKLTVAEFDKQIESQRKNLDMFTGKHKDDIEDTIFDMRALLQEGE